LLCITVISDMTRDAACELSDLNDPIRRPRASQHLPEDL